MEITYREITEWKSDEYKWIDMRDEGSMAYGMIPEAVPCQGLALWGEQIESGTDFASLPCVEELNKYKDKKLVIYCTRGVKSVEIADYLSSQGFEAYSLEGGYNSYLLERVKLDQLQESEKADRIEKSIQKKFHKELFSRFAKAINTYDLVQENDHIAVCISGGKDSMLMAKLFQELQRHRKFEFKLTFLVMDPGYSEANRKIIESNAKLMRIPVTIFETDIFDAVDDVIKSPCYLCARMRRGHLYSKAKELGCNKIALGHHYDDVIETILMGMLYGGQVQTMMPKLHSTNFEGMELIRPLYLIREDDIKHWRDYNDLYFLQCACHFTETCSSCRDDGTSNSKRLEIKRLIADMKKTNSFVEANIFKSVENVNLSTVIAYKENGIRHNFLENYDQNVAVSEE